MKGYKILKLHPLPQKNHPNQQTNQPPTLKKQTNKKQEGRKQQLSNIKEESIARSNRGQPFPSWLIFAWLAETHQCFIKGADNINA